MSFWIAVWTVVWFAGITIFSCLAVLVIWYGGRDIRSLLGTLEQRHRKDEGNGQPAEPVT